MADNSNPEESTRRSSMAAVFDRIQRTEGEVAQVREQLAGITVNLNSQSQTLSRIALTVEQRSATDWKTIWSAAAVLLAIIGMGANMVLQPIRQQVDANQAALERLIGDEIRRAEETGRYKERTDRNAKDLAELREVRDSAAP